MANICIDLDRQCQIWHHLWVLYIGFFLIGVWCITICLLQIWLLHSRPYIWNGLLVPLISSYMLQLMVWCSMVRHVLSACVVLWSARYNNIHNTCTGRTSVYRSPLHHTTSPYVGRRLPQAFHASQDYSNIWCNMIFRTTGDIYMFDIPNVWHTYS